MMNFRSGNACTSTTLPLPIPAKRKLVRAIFTGEDQT
jgi:hypothetical protein